MSTTPPWSPVPGDHHQQPQQTSEPALREGHPIKNQIPWMVVRPRFMLSGKQLAAVAGIPAFVMLVVGTAAGSGSATVEPEDVRDSDEYAALAEKLDQTEEDLASTQEDLADAEEDLETIAGDVPARETAVEAAEAELVEREAALTAAEDAVTERESAVGLVEDRIAANTFDGDGIYVVGDDIQPGTYRSEGGDYCYWERLSGLSGEFDDLIANDNVTGPAIVSISPGDAAFSTNRCGTWTLQD
ncbi:hypothetical protein [Nocardioides zeae]|uniref:Uncharacterized protein n=1 Tax=Nocardioides zeae TaxID=1457234 RepID=A0AAJ1X2M4_9ACTN|nr:hypothetical protein [Nocardioides zeae]MDQ1105439.1 hypothetical protein [Nocardioides zeae]